MVKCEVRGDRIRLSVIFLVLALLIITVFSGLDIWEASAASDATSDIEVNVDPWIRVTIPTDTVTLDLNPTTEADFDSANLAVTVATNNEPGYTLTMSPSDNITTDLTRKNGTETIPTLTELLVVIQNKPLLLILGDINYLLLIIYHLLRIMK